MQKNKSWYKQSCTITYQLIQHFPIRKTCLCNELPLIPHIYIVKLRFKRVYLLVLFLFLTQNIECVVVLMCTHNQCFGQKYQKYHFSKKIFNFYSLRKICIFLHGSVFIMCYCHRDSIIPILPESKFQALWL